MTQLSGEVLLQYLIELELMSISLLLHVLVTSCDDHHYIYSTYHHQFFNPLDIGIQDCVGPMS